MILASPDRLQTIKSIVWFLHSGDVSKSWANNYNLWGPTNPEVPQNFLIPCTVLLHRTTCSSRTVLPLANLPRNVSEQQKWKKMKKQETTYSSCHFVSCCLSFIYQWLYSEQTHCVEMAVYHWTTWLCPKSIVQGIIQNTHSTDFTGARWYEIWKKNIHCSNAAMVLIYSGNRLDKDSGWHVSIVTLGTSKQCVGIILAFHPNQSLWGFMIN